VDVELAWIHDVEDVMGFEERILAHVLTTVAAVHGQAIRELLGAEVTVPSVPFPRITMEQAHRLLGLGSIREATFLFRGPNRLTP
jgi:aspartyl/asparaginyl-tRNA synthetase